MFFVNDGVKVWRQTDGVQVFGDLEENKKTYGFPQNYGVPLLPYATAPTDVGRCHVLHGRRTLSGLTHSCVDARMPSTS